MDYRQMIKNKYSVRDYKDKKVDAKTAKAIRDYANHCPKLVDDIAVDIRFMDNSAVYRQIDGFAGYKGILIDAPHYAILLSEKKDHYIENAGYVGEGICLKAQELGVNTCWITFKDSKTIIHKLNIVTDKEVVGIIALGYGKKLRKRTIGSVKTGGNYTQANMDRKKDSGAGRMPLQQIVYIDKWGNEADVDVLIDRALYDPLDYARMAPSTLNRQPWRFIINGAKIILAVRDDEETDEYEEQIDAGIVMLYFEGVIEQSLCSIQWHLGEIENTYGIPEEYEIVAYCEV